MPRTLQRPFARWTRGLAGVGLAVACTACAQMPRGAMQHAGEIGPRDPFAQAAPRAPSTAGSARIARPPRAAMPGPSDIQLVAHEAAAPTCPPDAITSCPPEPRLPVAGPNPFAIGVPVCDVACQPSPFHYPDEYLCDGGDRALPVHYGEDVRLGLDTEDTIAEYQVHTGEDERTQSNRVCVYAPRFAALRTVSLPHEEGTFVEVAGVDHTGYGSQVQSRKGSLLGNRSTALGDVSMRARASGLASEQLPTDASQRLKPQLHDKITNTYQDFNVLHGGTFDQAAIARLNLGIGAALVWSRELSPVIVGKIDTAVTGLADVTATAVTVYEEQDQPGSLRLVKVADKQAAEPGDVITFSLRYDNLGGKPVSAVRIIDNLTPRLEYVEDSATCDVAGKLIVQDNGEGSLVLIWELDEPVAPKTGGVVTFQARVR